ncbi:hypothetical protein [Streptomyces sp. NPDC005548]|uniref:hypothetical protein n=1 Tax=Streptomyces sp. NPDC005548 TaxID=3364724 RepID=UPI00368E1020
MTWRQNTSWRRQRARAFEDLAADCTAGARVEPRSTGEEMALHLGIGRAHELTRNRPRLVADTVTGLPEERGDLDWNACSNDLFEDHDVLMLFEDSLDGIEEAERDVHQSPGMAGVELEPTDHPLAIEQRTGISLERVREIASTVLHAGDGEQR